MEDFKACERRAEIMTIQSSDAQRSQIDIPIDRMRRSRGDERMANPLRSRSQLLLSRKGSSGTSLRVPRCESVSVPLPLSSHARALRRLPTDEPDSFRTLRDWSDFLPSSTSRSLVSPSIIHDRAEDLPKKRQIREEKTPHCPPCCQCE